MDQLTPHEQTLICQIYDRLEYGFAVDRVFQWAMHEWSRTHQTLTIDLVAVIDSYLGVETLDVSTLD